jgi:hypothetical protein
MKARDSKYCRFFCSTIRSGTERIHGPLSPGKKSSG